MRPNYGLIQDIIRDVHEYVLGQSQVPYVPFNEEGNWEAFLPKYENQTTRQKEETSGCTVHGSQNQIETLASFLFKEQANYSERFTYNLVPIDPGRGADPQKTHETIRKYGLVDERDLPMTDTIEEYTDKSDITGSLLAKGQHWLTQYDYRHEWVWSPTKRPDNYIELLKDALRTSPLAVSVTAWRQENGVYVSDNGGNNHYCLLYKFDDQGYPWVFDTYDHSRKKLAKDHNIRRAKRIWLQKRTKKEMGIMIKLLQSVIKTLSMQKPTLYDVTKANLGIDVTPKDEVSDEYACAHVATTLMKMAYPETPIITGTATLYEWLLKQPTWKKTDAPDVGDIIISPTSYGNGSIPGHVGVLMENGLIASNNSSGVYKGRITENFTLESWNARYKVKGGFPVYFFRRV